MASSLNQQNSQTYRQIVKFTEQVKLNKSKPSIVMPISEAENLSQEITSLLALLVTLQSNTNQTTETVSVDFKGHSF